jgi:superfamily II DNA helicase RecQ
VTSEFLQAPKLPKEIPAPIVSVISPPPSALPASSSFLQAPNQVKEITQVPAPSKLSMLQCLRKLYGPNAMWRCVEQRNAVNALLSLSSDVILAMRTGIGKTAIGILPSMTEHGCTVIIVPLIALMEDWISRLGGLKLPFEHFTPQTTTLRGHANLILVSSDMAKTNRWRECLIDLNNRKPVIRQIVDESHYYFTDADFRSDALDNAYALRYLPTQMVVMSGTLPLRAEQFLTEQFVLTKPVVVRTHSGRPEIEYTRYPARNNIAGLIAEFQKQWTVEQVGISSDDDEDDNSGWTTKDRYLIYVSYVEDGFKVAEALGLEFYHAASPMHPITKEERQAIYNRWVEGQHIGLVATHALAAGNDYAHVRLTAHLG